MPQVQKPEVRDRILGAALAAFASRGYAAATMSAVAAEAGVAVANLYRYYASKEELFEAVVPSALVARFERLLERSVRAHAHLAGVARSGEDGAARDLLEFWIEQRWVVVLLLTRSAGTPHDGFGQRFVDRLVNLALVEIRAAHPGVSVSREARLVLQQIFDNTRRMIAAILEASDDDREIRRAVAAFRAYQVAGLAAFTRWLSSEGA